MHDSVLQEKLSHVVDVLQEGLEERGVNTPYSLKYATGNVVVFIVIEYGNVGNT